MSTIIRRRIIVIGRVQGVGYRAACARVAVGLGLTGGVRNLDDGTVEVVAVGPPEAVGRLTEWCRHGPRSARVDELITTSAPPDAPEGATSEVAFRW